MFESLCFGRQKFKLRAFLMGIEALTWILSLTAVAILFVLLGRLIATILKIAIVVAVVYLIMTRVVPLFEKDNKPKLKPQTAVHALY